MPRVDLFPMVCQMAENIFCICSADITDKPEYTHRGLILDTSRNYFPMRILRKVVDGLSYNKMNVFHWHITDSHSFPLELPNSIPELAQYGAYSKHKTYSPEQVKELVEYARVRGVKVLPEFDAPAHVGNGWQVWSPTEFFCLLL